MVWDFEGSIITCGCKDFLRNGQVVTHTQWCLLFHLLGEHGWLIWKHLVVHPILIEDDRHSLVAWKGEIMHRWMLRKQGRGRVMEGIIGGRESYRRRRRITAGQPLSFVAKNDPWKIGQSTSPLRAAVPSEKLKTYARAWMISPVSAYARIRHLLERNWISTFQTHAVTWL